MATAKAQDKAYAFLKQRILDGLLSAETAIVPEDNGKRLGISRMPVRRCTSSARKGRARYIRGKIAGRS